DPEMLAALAEGRVAHLRSTGVDDRGLAKLPPVAADLDVIEQGALDLIDEAIGLLVAARDPLGEGAQEALEEPAAGADDLLADPATVGGDGAIAVGVIAWNIGNGIKLAPRVERPDVDARIDRLLLLA